MPNKSQLINHGPCARCPWVYGTSQFSSLFWEQASLFYAFWYTLQVLNFHFLCAKLVRKPSEENKILLCHWLDSNEVVQALSTIRISKLIILTVIYTTHKFHSTPQGRKEWRLWVKAIIHWSIIYITINSMENLP